MAVLTYMRCKDPLRNEGAQIVLKVFLAPCAGMAWLYIISSGYKLYSTTAALL